MRLERSVAIVVLALFAFAEACSSATTTPNADTDAPDADVEETATTTADADADDADACAPAGRYQVGKEGGYRPCCSGLTEIFNLSPMQMNNAPVCRDPVGHRDYSCVGGTCGDGFCEVGEAHHCGCVADCPSAVWEDDANDASTTD